MKNTTLKSIMHTNSEMYFIIKLVSIRKLYKENNAKNVKKIECNLLIIFMFSPHKVLAIPYKHSDGSSIPEDV